MNEVSCWSNAKDRKAIKASATATHVVTPDGYYGCNKGRNGEGTRVSFKEILADWERDLLLAVAPLVSSLKANTADKLSSILAPEFGVSERTITAGLSVLRGRGLLQEIGKKRNTIVYAMNEQHFKHWLATGKCQSKWINYKVRSVGQGYAIVDRKPL